MNESKLKRVTQALIKSVAQTSFALSKEAIDRDTARKLQESAAKKVVNTFGIDTALKDVLPTYLRAWYENTKDGKVVIVKNEGRKDASRETVRIYTYGVDNYFRSRWPTHWAELKKREEKRRRSGKKSAANGGKNV